MSLNPDHLTNAELVKAYVRSTDARSSLTLLETLKRRRLVRKGYWTEAGKAALREAGI